MEPEPKPDVEVANNVVPQTDTFPPANQPQIIRAHQKDLFHYAALRDQVENVLRSWLGTRWITRWASEIEVVTRTSFLMLTSVASKTIPSDTQSLGEEYTDIWQYSTFTRRMPSAKLRAALILCMTMPRYLLARWARGVTPQSVLGKAVRYLPNIVETAVEINLACFYLFGRYYDITKRLFRIRHQSQITSIPENPNNPAPSYSLLGFLLSLRLLHRLYKLLKVLTQPSVDEDNPMQVKGDHGSGSTSAKSGQEVRIDSVPLSAIVAEQKRAETSITPLDPENDPHTSLDVASLSQRERAGRKCPLCLEERTASWWGKEKAECPLCRQPLSLNRLISLYNM
ncbi:peroxisome biogenesis factor 10 [Tulasnella sp. 403]|nr:peroxisome biogenesis factor 10 [Tulasnella sp. 403]